MNEKLEKSIDDILIKANNEIIFRLSIILILIFGFAAWNVNIGYDISRLESELNINSLQIEALKSKLDSRFDEAMNRNEEIMKILKENEAINQ